ncbi:MULTISPECIES: DUF3793 family protein [unclassified Lentimonas]|uniref:DUF3793 family protein n=1 Tax=unclassified Lentimonas TaxID=2630993 RepID=UPI0013230F43|nr:MULTISPECIES: DUF3793 family protein [unclassified Lentimonas]CAA6677218.1 Unannotated [Lentimonas sp. CC4]CAA6686157.1 Unannotated [Lentimonas sp. CC6]CAA7074189.1 Unannotated [Lentimonas sp. CC4]CAA7171547.1 Unannotated [Lentimonas sp. CC21]CAA7182026.1 Unannotated [Lentimonas sp. CC8]
MSLLTTPSLSSESFTSWRRGIAVLSQSQKRFDEWFFLNASTVLLSEKTGELLSIDLSEFSMTETDATANLQRLSEIWSVSCSVMYLSNGFLKFVVYQAERLQAALEQAPHCVMVDKLNYAAPLEAGAFMAELRLRWNATGELPHEIGVALGYPLEDVFGYMGLLPTACKGMCGWQVYGCLKKSTELSGRFNKARCDALVMLSKVAGSAEL